MGKGPPTERIEIRQRICVGSESNPNACGYRGLVESHLHALPHKPTKVGELGLKNLHKILALSFSRPPLLLNDILCLPKDSSHVFSALCLLSLSLFPRNVSFIFGTLSLSSTWWRWEFDSTNMWCEGNWKQSQTKKIILDLFSGYDFF